VKGLLEQALERPAGERGTWIAAAAGADAALAEEVGSLLEAHEGAGEFLSQPPGLEPRHEEVELEGRSVGPYRVLELIDRGGMGSVFRAVRDDDTFRTRSAQLICEQISLPMPMVKRREHCCANTSISGWPLRIQATSSPQCSGRRRSTTRSGRRRPPT
jgi:hypothetical protein